MILNPLTNIRPRIMSARIEHSKLFRLERPKPHKIVLNEQIHNTQIVSLMNKLNIKKSNDNVNSKAILNEKTSSFKKTNIKLPKLNRINEQNNIKTDNKENNVLKFNNCYGSPVLWMKKSNLKKLKSNTDSKVSPSLLKTLVHVNKFSNFCAINPKVCLPREKESKQNFEIDEQIVTSGSSIVPPLFLESSSINEKNEKSGSFFKTISKNLDLDPFLHKAYKGSKFNWIPGEVIYEGISSIIYKSLNESTGSVFIVKRYVDKKQVNVFERENEILQNIKHENIVQYYGNDKDIKSNNYFIYLEYISCGNLKTFINQFGPLKETLIKLYLNQILSALSYLHNEKHIAHRDIKCSNILIDTNGTIKLTDFGCAEIDNNGSLQGLKGSLPWCAPEVVGGGKYGLKCDIWSLGCTLIEMGGILPWNRNIDNYLQFINLIGRSEEVPEIPAHFSKELKSFISICLVRDVGKRADINILLNHPYVQKN